MNEIRFWRAVMSILVLGLVLGFLFAVWDVLLPFIFGLIIAYLIHPLVGWFAAWGLRRDRVVVVLYIILLAVGILLGSWLLPALYVEANAAISNLPDYAKAVNGVINSVNAEIHGFLSRFIGSRAEAFVIPFRTEKLLELLFHQLPGNILNVAHIGLWIFIVPFVCFFALSQSKKWVDVLFEWTPSEYVENLLGLLAEVNTTLGGYIRGLFFESLCIGFLTITGLLLLGVKGAILLGFVTALLNVIPFMALLVGGSVAMLAGFFQGLSVTVIFGILVLFVGVRIVDDFIIIPFVMGHNVKLHPVLTLFAILAGVELGGFIGLVFAIPLAAVVKVLVTVLFRSRKERIVPLKQYVFS